MRVLVLDTIHGGSVLTEALLRRGDDVDAVDVYRGGSLSREEAAQRRYDIIAAPVHLNPNYPLLHTDTKVVSHHEMTRDLLKEFSRPIIEITGSRGKTTAAFALASLFDEKTVLQTSRGTFLMPSNELLFKKSITPASLLFAAKAADTYDAKYVIAEESVGVTGKGELGILTSLGDYKIASGEKSALEAKLKSLEACKRILVPSGVEKKDNRFVIDDMVSVEGDRIIYDSGSFENELVRIPLYRDALKTATAAGILLGLDVTKLSKFKAVEGRMNLYTEDGVCVLDNSNSGTTADGVIEAAEILKKASGKGVILAIGQEHHAVCEGFCEEDIQRAVSKIDPLEVISVDGSFEDVRKKAVELAKEKDACVLLGVKTWR